MDSRYASFLTDISFIPRERIYTDELRRLTWGTDAGFYRLTPQIVVRSANEAEWHDCFRRLTSTRFR